MIPEYRRLIWIVLALVGIAGPINSASAAAVQFPTLVMHSNLTARVYADSNHVGNVVAMCFDRQGRMLTVDATRRLTGTWGVTMSRWWSMEDYAGKSLEDRDEMYARWAHIVPPAKLTRNADPLRRIADADGDGVADGSSVLREYNHPLDGNAAGVATADGSIYVANAPRLYRILPDGKQEVLFEGLGVRVGVYGHDLHGLAWGPDGRLYFSLGDRGFNVVSKERKRFAAPTRGGVFRCFPDGSGLELFHVGLRNPQDLEFNEYGDLFTVDNDMGGVDRSRVVHVVEGGDSGWDASYQLTRNFREETQRKDHTEPPWFTEGLWKTRHDGQPAWLHPPVAYLTHGPSGMEFDPGWGLPAEFRNHFFVCDFKGSSPRSGIVGFRLEPKGAGYEMVRTNRFAWGIAPTDIEFGWDARMYASDWISGWGGNGERRVVAFESQADRSPGMIKQVEAIVGSDFTGQSNKVLARRLGHRDRRVRRFAQSELARRGSAGEAVLRKSLTGAESKVVRRHALWGLWQIGLKSSLAKSTVRALGSNLTDSDAEIRAQTLRVIGDLRLREHGDLVLKGLEDRSARVRYFAAIAVGKLGEGAARPALANLLRANADDDLAVRHAAVYALGRIAEPGELRKLGDDPARSVRLAALLALRQRGRQEVRHFLRDAEDQIVHEAIRAIHDLPIRECWNDPILSDRGFVTDLGEGAFPIQQRLLNIRFRSGKTRDAAWLAECAIDDSQSEAVRLEALRSLEKWREPSPFDRVTWHHRPVEGGRDNDIIPSIARAARHYLLASNPSSTDAKLTEVAARLAVADDILKPGELRSLAQDRKLSETARLSFIGRLGARKQNAQVLRNLFTDASEMIQLASAKRLLAGADSQAEEVIRRLWKSKQARVRQAAVAAIADSSTAFATKLLSDSLGQARNKNVGATDLDLLEVGLESGNAALARTAQSWLKELRESTNRLAEFQLTLVGGDAAQGKRLFAEHAVQCVRCHIIKGFGGDAGPELTKIGRTLKPDQLVEALIDPSVRIAEGFGTFEFELNDGESIAGFVQSEDARIVKLALMDGRRIELQKKRIRSRSKPASAMPSMREALTRREIRDLVAYLSGLR